MIASFVMGILALEFPDSLRECRFIAADASRSAVIQCEFDSLQRAVTLINQYDVSGWQIDLDPLFPACDGQTFTLYANAREAAEALTEVFPDLWLSADKKSRTYVLTYGGEDEALTDWFFSRRPRPTCRHR